MSNKRIERFRIYVCAIALLTSLNAAAQNCVLVVATIHGFHKTNTNYPYSAITTLLQRWVPDAIGVEVRPEDVERPSSELRRFYPEEMVNIKDLFPRTRIFGFDWFGDDWAGQILPDDAFQIAETSIRKIKSLEKNMDADPRFEAVNKVLNDLNKPRDVAIHTFSMAEFNGNKYADICNAYYTYLDKATAGTKYQEVADFYQSRDKHLADNIATLLKTLESKKVAVLTGADHRDKVVHLLRQKFSSEELTIADPDGSGCGK